MPMTSEWDVVVVGAGLSGALIAKWLGVAGRRVLILEAGPALSDASEYLERYYSAIAKVPEAAYPPDLFDATGATVADPATFNAPRPTVLTLRRGDWNDPGKNHMIQAGPLAFASTYERQVGGTLRKWLGIALRFIPNDFCMQRAYDRFTDWPISFDDLEPWYGAAEHELGVAADVAEQAYLGINFGDGYEYPMPKIPPTLVDAAVARGIEGLVRDGIPLTVTATPAARNSRPYGGRPACEGNTSCIPICPIGAKYDPIITLREAVETKNVEIWPQTVATEVVIGESGRVREIAYLHYDGPRGPQIGSGRVRARAFVLAGNAIETPRLLLMSRNGGRLPDGVANGSGLVGRYLMDHPQFLARAITPEPVYPFRGPLATSGIENLRDGMFRRDRAAYRIEIGNVGWNWAAGDPDTTTVDFINGMNRGGLNGRNGTVGKAVFGRDLVMALNDSLTRQLHISSLVEQDPCFDNRIALSAIRDRLGLPRPEVHYDLSDYTKLGLLHAERTAAAIFDKLRADQFPEDLDDGDPRICEVIAGGRARRVKFRGSGHPSGTYRMGRDRTTSVVDREQRSWDHPNLFLVGSGVFPTVATANPSLTIAALALWAASTILKQVPPRV
jgi:glucose dehydrogenase